MGSNISSLQAQRRLAEASRNLRTASERLASGQRINRASDDAAGLAISSSLNSDARVFGQATRNINDGISALNIADSAVGQLSEIVTRLQELAEQSANGSFSRTQRQSIDKEGKALTDEYNRILATTSFNGLNLLNGTQGRLNIQLGYGSQGSVGVSTAQGLSRNKSSGTYAQQDPYSYGAGTNGAAIFTDLNGDGIADLVAGDSAGASLVVRLGLGDGSFDPITYDTVAIGGEAQKIVSLDFNGDGKQDIAALAGNGNSLAVYLGQGDGNLQLTDFKTSLGAVTIAAGDVTSDGKQDIALLVSGTARIYNGNSSGTLTVASQASIGSTSDITLGDQNGDGRLDIIGSGSTLRVASGDGRGNFGAATVTSGLSAGWTQVATGDFNMDGLLDAVVTYNQDTFLEVYTGKADGSFSKTAKYSGFNLLNGSNVADMNGDGYADIVVSDGSAQQGITVFQGRGDGSFSQTNVGGDYPLGGMYPSSPALGDLNGDGVLDIGFVFQGGGQLAIMLSDITTTNDVPRINLTTQSNARDAITYLGTLRSNLQTAQSVLGAGTSRLGSALGAVQSRKDSEIAAASRIVDADVASESAQLTKNQILEQVAASVLTQANQTPNLVLQLLRI